MRIPMRSVVLIATAFCAIVAAGRGQTTSLQEQSVAPLLAQLHSAKKSERAEAYQKLRSNPTALRNPMVRAALLDLLDRENQELDASLLATQKTGHDSKANDDGDGYAEYYGFLLDTVDSFANWNDPHQACVLVSAGSSPDSPFAAEVARHAKTSVPCLLQRCKSEARMNRVVACPVLVQALAKGKDSLDSGSLQTGHQTVLSALQDPDEGVRIFTVDALGSFGGREFIPALKQLQTSDPASDDDGGVKHFGVREHAAHAIAAIQRRADQN